MNFGANISLKSALAGWCAGMLYCIPLGLWQPGLSHAAESVCTVIGMVLAVVIFGVWLIALLPFALLVPSHSSLWSEWVLPPLAGIVGLGATAFVLYSNALANIKDWPPDLYDWHVNFKNMMLVCGPLSIVVGLATGLTGAFLHRRSL
jgi:hypothetical protein